MKRRNYGTLLAVVLLVCCTWIWTFSSTTAFAHGAIVEYMTTQQTITAIVIHATYDNGTPMGNAQVTVFAPDDPATPWQKGVCDEQGAFSFVPDTSRPGTWEVQVRKSGHGAVVYVPVEQMGASDATSDVADASPPASATAQVLSGSSKSHTPLQYILMGSCVVWGFVGTALYFSSNTYKRST